MSAIEPKILTLLKNNTGVSALVSSRIFPVMADEPPTYPHIVYFRTPAGHFVNSLSGFSGLENPIFQIDCMATTYLGAKAVSDAVKLAMNGATTFKSTCWNEEDMPFDIELQVYGVSLDFSIWNQKG